MSLRDKRNETREAILKGRFVGDVLTRNSKDIDQEVGKRVSGFTSAFWADRNFAVSEGTMTYIHLKQHRFVNMKTRSSRVGIVRKKSHPTHNQVLYGHANEIVKELVVGFTDGTREQMMQLGGFND